MPYPSISLMHVGSNVPGPPAVWLCGAAHAALFIP
jgi:hypothetical protein